MAGAFHPLAFDEYAFDVDVTSSEAFFATIAGVARRIEVNGMTISEVADETPNRASFTVSGFVPNVGNRVVLTRGGITNPERLFAGTILSIEQGYRAANPENQFYRVSCIDDHWRLNTRKVIGQFTGTADAIVLELMALYAPTFTTVNVVADLPLIEGGIVFTNQDLTDALTQIAKRIGGYWYLDYVGDLHFFLTETGDDPDPLDAAHTTMREIQIGRDLSQIVTRVYVEGGGGTALTEVPIDETILPVTVATWYNPAGGVVQSGPQRITYGGVELGGDGGLVGTGAAPPAALGAVLSDGSGVEDGAHSYAYTYVTGAGETIASPVTPITVGSVLAPAMGPTAGAPTVGSGVTTGDHYYGITFVTAVGETTGSPVSNTVSPGPITLGLIDPPVSSPTAGTPTSGGSVTLGGTHQIAITFINGAGETTAGPTVAKAVPFFPEPNGPSPTLELGGSNLDIGRYSYGMTFVTSAGETTYNNTNFIDTISIARKVQLLNIDIGPSGTTARKIYRSKVQPPNSSDLFLLTTIGDNTTTTYLDDIPDASLGAAIPTTNTATLDKTIPLTNIPIGGAGTTGRKIYMTVASGAQLKFVSTISNNTATTASITTADGSLGADVPTSNTTATTTNYNVVPLTGIPIGPANVTSRKVYRTAAGGAQLKLVATIANNSATTYSDTLADGSLGANIPGANTADANRVALTAISVGPSGTTQRKVYRTVAAGSQLKLLTTVADNTTTTYTDSTADASLGANVPTSDTSGLSQPAGQVIVGSTSIAVAGIGPFPAAGWAVIGNGEQVIRYTGTSSTALTGVPASGAGSITGTIAFNSSITVAPQLTGIPAGDPGDGSITYLIPKGDDVNLLVQVDSVAAQAVVGALILDDVGDPTDGIIEAFVQDRRLAESEALARGQAYLDMYSTVEITLRYQSRDRKTTAGRFIEADIDEPMPIAGTFKIQTVDITFLQQADGNTVPFYDVVASTTRFSFEDLLRQARARG